MKNEDIFKAIDNIDDKLVNDAGKYLGGFADTDPVEVRPAARRLSPAKIIAPIAAAVAVVCGVALVAGSHSPFTYSPANEGTADSENTTENSEADNTDVSGDEETPIESEVSESDPFKWDYLYDVDEKYLPVGFDGIKLLNADGSHYLTGEQGGPYEYGGFMTRFVYYAEPKGANYNSADNPEAFAEGFVYDNSADFKRIAAGDRFGSLSVDSGSYTVFARDAENSPNEAPIYFHGSSFLMFNGYLTIEDAYLVKHPDSDGAYYCIPRNGAAVLPIISETVLDDGSYGSLVFEGNLSGLEYKTEQPPIIVRINDPKQQKFLDEFLAENSYAKVRVHITDVQMWDYPNSWFRIYSEGGVLSIQTGSAEPKEVAALINSEGNTAELKADLMEQFGFTDVRVLVHDSYSNGDLTGDEITDEKLVPGMTVAVYDENGFCGRYTYGDHK